MLKIIKTALYLSGFNLLKNNLKKGLNKFVHALKFIVE